MTPMMNMDVLAVMESDARCAKESRERNYDAELLVQFSDNSEAARAAVAELIEASKAFAHDGGEHGWHPKYRDAAKRLRDAIAGCGGA